MQAGKPHPDARLLDYDEVTGVTRWWMDLGDGRAAVCTQTPLDDLFDLNAEQMAASLHKQWGDGQVAARIPLDVYYGSGYAKAREQGDEAWCKRFLNDSDNAKFRTFRGRL